MTGDDLAKMTQTEWAWRRHLGRSNPWQRETWPREQRVLWSEAQNWRCCYCGTRMDGSGEEPNAPTIEHIIPRGVGGPDVAENIVMACLECNQERGSRIDDLHVLAISIWEGWAA